MSQGVQSGCRHSLFVAGAVADCRRDARRELASEIGRVGPVDRIELPHVEVETLRAIAGALNARGVSTATGKGWEAATVANVLRRLG